MFSVHLRPCAAHSRSWAAAPDACATPPAGLTFVHGLSTSGIRGNLAYNADGAAIITAGSVGAIYSKRTHAQASRRWASEWRRMWAGFVYK